MARSAAGEPARRIGKRRVDRVEHPLSLRGAQANSKWALHSPRGVEVFGERRYMIQTATTAKWTALPRMTKAWKTSW